jgi:acyl-CoA reductase-like NAD-dependent aldehyde dehydrogenase
VRRKVALLTACRAVTFAVARRWAELAAGAKGTLGTSLAGEEAITGPWAVLNSLNRFVATLREIEREGEPVLDPRRVRVRANGQVVVEVFPADAADRLLQLGLRADVWMQPGVTRESLPASVAVWYGQPSPLPQVVAVLGAGNISSIGLLDVLYKLVAEGSVCLLKVHPLFAHLSPVFAGAFAPLIDEGYLRLAEGGAAVGRYLCTHPLVDAIHVTGSEATYAAIAADNPSHKPITSELGNVSPAIVLPGEWSQRALRFHAEQLASAKLHNNGFNCIALQVLVLPAQWRQKEALLAEIRRAFETASDRIAYYPGARERYADLVARRSGVSRFGGADETRIARTIVAVEPADLGEPFYSTEAFCPVLAVVSVEAAGVAAYLRAAVDFCNDRLRGDLAASLLVDASTAASHPEALDEAIAALRYGCIGVNIWSGVGFLLPAVPWGAYRGGELATSGFGVVHNTRLFSLSQKAVLHAPFLPPLRALKPPWFITHRNQPQIGLDLCEFERSGSPAALAKVAWHTLTG